MYRCHLLKLISGRGRGLEPDRGEEFPRNRHSQSTILHVRRDGHRGIPKTESTAGHLSSCRTRRWSSPGRWGGRRGIWPSRSSRVMRRCRSPRGWRGRKRGRDQHLGACQQRLWQRGEQR
jgi:hypothetical protein